MFTAPSGPNRGYLPTGSSSVGQRGLEIRGAGRPHPKGMQMAHWHGISRRKPTGGRLKRPNRYRGKRRTEIAAEKQFTTIGEPNRKVYRKRSGSQTVRALHDNVVNVADTKSGKVTQSGLTNVMENPADPNYVRRNIVTKGAIVETDMGKVRITSRPGSHGALSGVLLDE